MGYTKYILCGLFAFGIFATGYSSPHPEDGSSTSNNGETVQNDQSDDYEYEDRNLPADPVKSTAFSPKSTMLPYFDMKIVRRTVKPGSNISLECPVKNLADTNVILWFKGENTITNNLNVLDNAYEVEKHNFSLIIKNATETFNGIYYCEIAPQKIRLQTILKVTNETTPTIPTESKLPQAKEAITSTMPGAGASDLSALVPLVLLSILMSNLSKHRCSPSLLYC
ncbi:uncharacterized protein LOC129951724 [Eupeodes corollae]|uniref:uncharacterized protein LOC129951724 n=1 Tax=Eupeodes corollae TaxID=290404 RepID=UPI002493A410|nr:uncharacterized protein LOC129951724 [Eupeodes corollae]